MGKYNGAVITTAGQNIIAESISGTLLEWTVMRSSSVAIPAGTNLEALTSLTGIEQSTHITDASVYGNNVLQVSARFSNTGVSTAYLIQTVGIYGQLTGGSETLIAVMTAVTPDEMPAYDPDSPSAFIFNTQITVTNADSVTMVVNDTGTATVADLNRKVDISGGDVSDTVVNTVVAESAEYPVPAAGDTVKVIIGKIAKFFADIVRPFTGATASASGAKGLVPAPSAGQQTAYMRGDGQWTQPQNNATTTQNGYVLDAKMGKTLQDQITSLNDSFTARLKSQSSGIATLDTTYFQESSVSWYAMDNLVFVDLDAAHLKSLAGFTLYEAGSGFPASRGSKYCVSSVMTNDQKVPAVFTINTEGRLSIITRSAITAGTTVFGRIMYVIK